MKNEENAGQKLSVSQPNGPDLYSLVALLGLLVQGLSAQTDAITRLAQSNEALVEAMGQEDPDMLDLPVRHLDGSPVL